MTVHELIEILSKLNPDLSVQIMRDEINLSGLTDLIVIDSRRVLLT